MSHVDVAVEAIEQLFFCFLQCLFLESDPFLAVHTFQKQERNDPACPSSQDDGGMADDACIAEAQTDQEGADDENQRMSP